jgi:hypothetical protein
MLIGTEEDCSDIVCSESTCRNQRPGTEVCFDIEMDARGNTVRETCDVCLRELDDAVLSALLDAGPCEYGLSQSGPSVEIRNECGGEARFEGCADQEGMVSAGWGFNRTTSEGCMILGVATLSGNLSTAVSQADIVLPLQFSGNCGVVEQCTMVIDALFAKPISTLEIRFTTSSRFFLDDLRFFSSGSLSVLQFDESSFALGEPINAMAVGGVSFDFSVGGTPSEDASVEVLDVPGDTPLLTPPFVEGNASGVLTLTFDPPVGFAGFNFAVDEDDDVSPAVRVTAFDDTGAQIAAKSAAAFIPEESDLPEGFILVDPFGG